MPIFLPALAALPGVGTAATGLVGVGGLAAAAPAISLSAIASWGILGGSFLYQTLNQPKGVDGPRLTNFSIRQSEYGLMKPLVWGSMRVNGNVIWPNQAALLITERKFSIEGGAVNKYQYYGTWAAAFGDGECAFIPKIWLDNKVFFDMTDSATQEDWIRAKQLLQRKPLTGDIVGQEEIRIYTGSETQTPDAYMESIDGAGNVQAYRGTPYILFRNILLTYDYGNQIPSVSALVSRNGRFALSDWKTIEIANGRLASPLLNPILYVKDDELHLEFNRTGGSAGYYVEPFSSRNGSEWVNDSARGAAGMKQSNESPLRIACAYTTPNGYSWLIGEAKGDKPYVYLLNADDAIQSATPLALYNKGGFFPRSRMSVGMSHTGEVFFYGGLVNGLPTQTLFSTSNGNQFALKSNTGGAGYRTNGFILHNGTITLHIGGKESNNSSPEHNAVYRYNSASKSFTEKLTSDLTGQGQDNAQVLGACMWRDFTQTSGDIFTVLVRLVSGDRFLVYQSADGVAWKPMTDRILSIQVIDQASKKFTAAGDQRYTLNNPGRFFVDDSTGNDGEYTIAGLTYNAATNQTDIEVNESIVSSIAAGNIRHYPIPGNLSAAGFDRDNLPGVAVFYDQLFVLGGADANRIAAVRESFQTSDVTLQRICEDLAQAAGADASEYDFSELAAVALKGHQIDALTSAKEHLLPLQRANFFDLVCYDGKVKALLRASRPSISIDETDLGAYKAGATPPDRIDLEMKSILDLPRAVEVVYYDVDKDFQSNTQAAFRRHCQSSTTKQVNLNVAMSAAQAAKAAEVLLWDAYAERYPAGVNLPYKYARLTPADVLSFAAEGINYSIRLTGVDCDGGLVKVKGVPSRLEIYDANPPSPGATSRRSPSSRKASTNFELLDIADFRGNLAETDFGFWFVAGSSGSSGVWPGAQLWRVNAADEFTLAAETARESCLGNADSVLNAPAVIGLQDNANYVDVEIVSGADRLQSIADSLMWDDVNLAVLGDELLTFARVTYMGGNVYRLSRLLRGLYGTEWALQTHQPAERFALLENAVRVPLSAVDVSVAHRYQVTTIGESANPNALFPFACQGIAKKPYAPVLLEAKRLPSGTWLMQWFGSGRGIWKQYEQGGRPRIEGVEEYEIDFLTGDYPIIDVDPVRNGLVVAGDCTALFAVDAINATPWQKEHLVNVSSPPRPSRDLTLLSSELLEGNTLILVLESVAGISAGAHLRIVHHIQEVPVQELHPNAKAYFYLDVLGTVKNIAAPDPLIQSAAYQCGQKDIYGGMTDSISIQVCQTSPTIQRGYAAEGTFTV